MNSERSQKKLSERPIQGEIDSDRSTSEVYAEAYRNYGVNEKPMNDIMREMENLKLEDLKISPKKPSRPKTDETKTTATKINYRNTDPEIVFRPVPNNMSQPIRYSECHYRNHSMIQPDLNNYESYGNRTNTPNTLGELRRIFRNSCCKNCHPLFEMFCTGEDMWFKMRREKELELEHSQKQQGQQQQQYIL